VSDDLPAPILPATATYTSGCPGKLQNLIDDHAAIRRPLDEVDFACLDYLQRTLVATEVVVVGVSDSREILRVDRLFEGPATARDPLQEKFRLSPEIYDEVGLYQP